MAGTGMNETQAVQIQWLKRDSANDPVALSVSERAQEPSQQARDRLAQVRTLRAKQGSEKNMRAKSRPRHFAISTFHWVQGSPLPKEA
jgi:hypothetical protein